MKLNFIILSGGSDSRLWPSSRASLLKQFNKFWKGATLYGDTIKRLNSLQDRKIILLHNQNNYFTKTREFVCHPIFLVIAR